LVKNKKPASGEAGLLCFKYVTFYKTWPPPWSAGIIMTAIMITEKIVAIVYVLLFIMVVTSETNITTSLVKTKN